MKHILSLFDLSKQEVQEVLQISKDLKNKLIKRQRDSILPRRVLALLFEKPSLRTRVSFEAGIRQLGGSSIFLGSDVGFGKRESIADFTQVLSSYCDVIVCRTYKHETALELAEHSKCPIINGLTDYSHPCQALADVLTIHEHAGTLDNQRVAYIGDSNNVARSLVTACSMLDIPISVACPKGYEFDDDYVKLLNEKIPKNQFVQTNDPEEAANNATAIYTDVWASMGQEKEKEERAKSFADYQVNQRLMDRATDDACFLHCLPAHRGEEVSAEVMDGRQSVVIQQAENRMHAQKGLMTWLLT